MTDKITPKKTKKPAKSKGLEKDLIDQVEKIAALKAQVLYAQAESENNRKRAPKVHEKKKKKMENWKN